MSSNPKALNLEAIITKFALSLKDRASNATIHSRIAICRKLMRTTGKPLSEITEEDVQRYLRGKALATARAAVSVLSDFTAFCTKEGYISGPFVTKNCGLKIKAASHRCLDNDEVDRILAAADTMPTLGRALAHFLITTGVRASEALAAKVSDIDLATRTVTVHNRRWIKTKVRFSEKCASLLEMLMVGKSDEQLLFSGERYRMSMKKIYDIVHHVGNLAGLNRQLSAHMFRHTYASSLHLAPLMGGGPSSTVDYIRPEDESKKEPEGGDDDSDLQ
jgi:site-specific recombinase XerD